MQLHLIDWGIIFGFLALTLIIGVAVMKRAGKSSTEFFVSGRNMPWWLLGCSMVATTFSTDTPNLVTDLVRTNGVAGNWAWWAFLLTGMLTVFVYARLWRRSEVLTDIEFYELRYSGKSATFLRAFRAIYLGVFFNVMIMAMVTLAAIKISSIMLGIPAWQTVLVAGVVTVIFSALGGLSGVLITDFILFIIAMAGAFIAAFYALQQPGVGGLSGLISNPAVSDKLSLLPPLDFSSAESRNVLFGVLLVPLAIQWWSVWYPGAEPGGGGYLAQRMLAAKNEKHATGATLLFNVAHYALRPWPWIIVALASLIVFPDLASIKTAFPNVSDSILKNDLAYPAMLTFLPKGLLGLVLASLVAAYISTISTHLNWGSSYIVNDVWHRFVRKDAGEKELVAIGRISTVVLMALTALLSLQLVSAYESFQILLQVGAGTGLLFILRWFWWRINAWSEISAMIISFAVALIMHLGVGDALEAWQKLVIGVGITTVGWIHVTLLTRPTETDVLRSFYKKIQPGGPGWGPVIMDAGMDGEDISRPGEGTDLPLALACMSLGCLAVFSALFSTGYFLYGRTLLGGILAGIAVVSGAILVKLWHSLRMT